MHFSGISEAGQRREIGLNDLLLLTRFPGLRSWMIVDCFHMDGVVLDDIN